MRSEHAVTTVVGAGPYGLSIAAHLRHLGVPFRIFGTPMLSWRQNMPKGMLLKSEGFASDLYDPEQHYTLKRYCDSTGLPYADIGTPVPIQTFIDYGLDFQQRAVPDLEPYDINDIRSAPEGFLVTSASGETFRSKTVAVASGITHFAYLPERFRSLPSEQLSHSSAHHDLSGFGGKRVAVIGAGASAIDTAALLHEAGADVHLIARRRAIAFHEPTVEPRPLWQRLKAPRSGLGLGWRSRLCTDAPLVFHALPQRLRHRIVRRHLGPAPGWPMKSRVVGKFPIHTGASIREVHSKGDIVRLEITAESGTHTVEVDHVIAATGYQVDITRIPFLHPSLRSQLQAPQGIPVLNTHFESSVPGLYFVGLASAYSFGPLSRFAYGAKFAARRVSNHLRHSL